MRSYCAYIRALTFPPEGDEVLETLDDKDNYDESGEVTSDKYRGISLQRELVDKIEEFIKSHPERGYKSLADFVTEAVRKRCEELKILVPTPPGLPELEHFNIYEDHVTVIDHKERRIANVYFRNNTVFCDICETKNCRHVEYVLNLPKVNRILTEKGWTIKQGKIIRPY